LVRCDVYIGTTAGTIEAAGRICLDDVPVVATGKVSVLADYVTTYLESYLTLAAGVYSIDFDNVLMAASGGTDIVRITNINIGEISFNDSDFEDGDSGDIVVAGNFTTQTMCTETITTDAARALPIGSIKKYHVTVIATGKITDETASVVHDVGTGDTADRVNWKIYLDAVQQAWTVKTDDYDGGNEGEGCYGRYSFLADPATSYVIELKATNGFGVGVDKTCRGYISVICSPWILSDASGDFLTLNFPPGSTLYIENEPLSRITSGTVQLGKVRATSFGTCSDYYAISTGTCPFLFSYTYEIISVSGPLLYSPSWGRCISAIAVDQM
jgi:archaellin